MSNKEITRVPEILPDNLAAESVEFVTFLKKYYEWMGQDGNPSADIDRSLRQRTLDNAVDFYLSSLYNELGYGFVLNKEANQLNIINNLSEIYSAKGSLQSIKVMFRALFGEEIDIKLPKEEILKTSSGNWLSQYSVMVKVDQGDPYTMVGKYVEVETVFPNTPAQTFDVEVKSVKLRDETKNVYEVFVSRYFAGFFYFNSIIRYKDFQGTLSPSMSQILNIEEAGTGFRVGEVFDINDYVRESNFNNLAGIPTSFRRRVPAGTKLGKNINSTLFRFEIEDVDVDVRSDGTITQVIKSKGSVTTRIIRGRSLLTRIEFENGVVREFRDTIEGIATPNLAVNWDEISSALTELAAFNGLDGTVSIAIYNFLKDTPDIQYNDGSGIADPLFDAALTEQNQRGNFDNVTTGDTNGISIDDCMALFFYSFDITSAAPPGSLNEQRYAKITQVFREWNSYATRNGLSGATLPDSGSGDTPIDINLDICVDVLRLALGGTLLSISDQTTRINETAADTGFVKGDIDNDGVIDTDDLITMIKYTDPVLRTTLTTAQLTWIDSFLVPANAVDHDEEASKVLTAIAVDFHANNRNELHDFLLEVDGDYATGRVRGDITQNGSITIDDVRILLQRAAGYYDVSKGSINGANVNKFVGGYVPGSGSLELQNVGDGDNSEIKPVIRDGVITSFEIESTGEGLREATGIIVKPENSFIENLPEEWAIVGNYYHVKLNIRNGRLDSVSNPGIMYNFPENPVEMIAVTKDNGVLEPVINSSGEVTSITVVDGGTGYNAGNSSITVFGSRGGGFEGSISTKNNVIDKIVVTDGGSGYTASTVVSITGASSGTGANLEPIIVDGVLTGVNIIDGGRDYDPDTDYISVSDSGGGSNANISGFETISGVISSVTVSDSGSGYVEGNAQVLLSRGSSSTNPNWPRIKAVVQDKVITNIDVTQGGDGYPETGITVSNTLQRYTPTLEAVTDENGSITDIVTSGSDSLASLSGWDQLNPPTVSITDTVDMSIRTTVSSTHYVFRESTDRIGSTGLTNPTINISLGDTVAFRLPIPTPDIEAFYIKSSLGSGSTGAIVDSTVVGQGSSLVEFTPTSAGTYYYQSGINPLQAGEIIVSATGGATAIVDLDSGKIANFIITNASQNYTDPSVTLVGSRDNVTINVVSSENYVKWIDEVIAEPLLGSSYNPILVDGPGSGARAIVKKVGSQGQLEQLELLSFGYDYPETFTTIIAPLQSGESNAKVTFSSGIIGISTPNYVDRKGFLSDIIKIQDNDLYQEFSYVVQTGVDFDIFEDLIKKSVHPAGMKIFGEQSINEAFFLGVQQFDQSSIFYNRIFFDRTDNGSLDAGPIFGGDGYGTFNSDEDTYEFTKDLPSASNPTDSTADADDDGSVFDFTKARADTADAQEDGSVFDFTKARADTADAQEDGSVFFLTKPRSDVADAQEADTFFLTKPRSDVGDAQEAHTYFFNKAFPTALDPTDSTADAEEAHTYFFTKKLTDTADAEEDGSVFFLTKPRSDVGDAQEAHTYFFNKKLTDIGDAQEAHTYNFTKAFPTALDPTDSTADADDNGSVFDFTKKLTDVGDAQEDGSVFNFTKARADTADADDNGSVFDFTKKLTDTADTQEAHTYFFTKKLTDIGDAQEAHTYRFTKDITPDEDHINEESAYAISTDTFFFNKLLSDVGDAQEAHTYFFNKKLTDIGDAQEDGGIIDFTKKLTDIGDAQEAHTYFFNKKLTDTATVDDDSLAIDDDIYFFTKKLTDNVDVQERIGFDVDTITREFGFATESHAVLLTKPLSDVGDAQEAHTYNFTKASSDSLDINNEDRIDNTKFNFTKKLTDTGDAQESNTYLFTKKLTDTGDAQEAHTHNFTKKLTDVGDADDDGSIFDFTKKLSDIGDAGDDGSVFNFTKKLSDTATMSDNYSVEDSDVFDINKRIQDLLLGITDSGSTVLTRNYVDIGYIANGLDYEYSSETSEGTF